VPGGTLVLEFTEGDPRRGRRTAGPVRIDGGDVAKEEVGLKRSGVRDDSGVAVRAAGEGSSAAWAGSGMPGCGMPGCDRVLSLERGENKSSNNGGGDSVSNLWSLSEREQGRDRVGDFSLISSASRSAATVRQEMGI
jgi:hypothetical protein